MQLPLDKFIKIVSALTEKLPSPPLMSLDVSNVLMAVLEEEGIIVGGFDTDDDHVVVPVSLEPNIYEQLVSVIKKCNQADKKSHGTTEYGQLDAIGFFGMLARAAAKTVAEPESMEAHQVNALLKLYGYE